jgi:heat shock protein HtpX
VVKLALSRSRELLADAGSVELTKNPDAMISALRKIENRGELPGATSAVMELCVDNPREGFADLFATHPSVDSRVQALVKFAGGHDPGQLVLPSDGPNEPDNGPREAIGADQPTPLPQPGPWADPGTSGPWGKRI